MAGLEVLYSSVAGGISCPQDALVCYVHWDIIKNGYRCIGSGDEPSGSDKMSELLPPDWGANKELYSLRYKAKDDDTSLLLKAILDNSILTFYLMNANTEQVAGLTVNVNDHVDAQQLQNFESVFKDTDSLSAKVRSQLLLLPDRTAAQSTEKERQREQEEQRQRREGSDPLYSPTSSNPRFPLHGPGRSSIGPNPMFPLLEPGRADLDPFGPHGHGGMIVDPLRSGFPRSGFDPSGGIPGVLPPGAVPPGARFDPFGPVGQGRPGPDPDHMPPPGFDDMFM